MEFVNVLIAAVGAFAFGAVWYMSFAKQWMNATGITDAQQQGAGAKPYILAMVGAILTAGMLRHIFAAANIEGIGPSVTSAFGIGLFIAAPWIINNCAFEGRPTSLMWINGGYAVGGCTVIGLILSLF
jgi:hypothetical protein